MEQDVVILRPPVAGPGIEVLINNRPFTCPMAIKRGGQVRINYKKNGLEGRPVGSPTMYTQFTATQNLTCEMPQLEWYKLVSFAMVDVKGQDGQAIPYSLWINDKEIANGYGVYLKENELSDVRIRVESTGWKSHTMSYDMHTTPLYVRLQSAYEEPKPKQEKEPKPQTVATPQESNRSDIWKVILIGIVCFALGLGLGWRLFAPKVATTIHSTTTQNTDKNTD